jgi:hypothetical protein
MGFAFSRHVWGLGLGLGWPGCGPAVKARLGVEASTYLARLKWGKRKGVRRRAIFNCSHYSIKLCVHACARAGIVGGGSGMLQKRPKAFSVRLPFHPTWDLREVVCRLVLSRFGRVWLSPRREKKWGKQTVDGWVSGSATTSAVHHCKCWAFGVPHVLVH